MAKKAKEETIDFSGVEEERSQRSKHIPAGDYAAKVAGVVKKWKDNDKSNVPYFRWQLQITEGKYKGVPFYFTTSLKTEALFNLRNLILSCTGKNVAGKKKFNFDPQKLIGRKLAITVDDDEYEGKMRSQVVDTQPISSLEDDEDEEEDEESEEEDEEDEEDSEEEKDEDLEELDVDDEL